MKTEDIEYRGYTLAVIQYPSAWRVGIYRRRAGTRGPKNRELFPKNLERDAAISKAQRRVDVLLATPDDFTG